MAPGARFGKPCHVTRLADIVSGRYENLKCSDGNNLCVPHTVKIGAGDTPTLAA